MLHILHIRMITTTSSEFPKSLNNLNHSFINEIFNVKDISHDQR